MTNTDKMTNKKALNYVLENFDVPDDVAEKLNGMLAQLEKRTGIDHKPSARQIANESIKQKILDSMEINTLYSISNMLKNFGFDEDMTSQRVSALVSQLVAEGKIERIEDKRKAYFQLA